MKLAAGLQLWSLQDQPHVSSSSQKATRKWLSLVLMLGPGHFSPCGALLVGSFASRFSIGRAKNVKFTSWSEAFYPILLALYFPFTDNRFALLSEGLTHAVLLSAPLFFIGITSQSTSCIPRPVSASTSRTAKLIHYPINRTPRHI